MIKESKYIIRRILIGVGIVLVLGFLRSNKVHALEDVQVSWLNSPYNTVSNDSSYQLLAQGGTQRIYRNRDTGYFAFCWASYSQCDIMNPSDYFEYNNVGLQIKSTSDQYYDIAYFTNNGSLPTFNSGSPFSPIFNSNTFQVILRKSSFLGNNPSIYTKIGNNGESGSTIYGYRTYFDYFSNISWTPYSGKNSTSFDILPPSTPDFLSWNWTKISNNNIITGISLRPEFSFWDTTNFDYQYKIGKNSNTWLSLTQNKQLFTYHNNGVMLYIRVKRKSDDSVVLGANFTTSDIGKFANTPDFDIKFFGEYRTENYLNNNVSSRSVSLIKNYQIEVDYVPKNSILKYQYQYITSGTCNDVQTWQQVSSSDNGNFIYVASENGKLCARILDSSDNVKKEAEYEVNTIDLLAFDSGDGKLSFFEKISNKIDYGGPITILFKIPVDFFSTLYNTAANSNSCVPYKISTLMGTDITLPCINFRDKFGSTIYNEIDAIFTFIFAIGFFKFIYKKYDEFVSLENPDKRGDK